MRHLLILISLLSTLSFIGCRDESDAIYLIDRAESLLKSDPDSSHILLDSIAVPDNLSDKLLARWCMLSGKVADTLYTDLPYVQQLLRAQAYYKSHGTKQEQAKIGLYLGRSYVEDKENEKAMKVYLQALDIALRSEDYNQAGYICSYMGDLYDFEGNYLLGKDKYKEAESYFRKAGNMRSSAFALRDVGRMYAFSDSLDIALIFLLKADTIIVEVGDSSDIGTIYNGIGNIYNMLGNKELAKLYLWKNVNMSDFDDAPSYRTLAGIYIEEGDFKNARICLEKASVPSFNDMTRFSVLYGDGWGLQTGAYINFPQSRLFSIQTGLLLHTAGNSFSYGDDWNIDFFVPVYASFHIPLSDKVNLRLNAGAYTGSGEYWNLGATAAAGIEVKRFYVGVNYFQNCVNDRDLKLGLSVGYKFTLF